MGVAAKTFLGRNYLTPGARVAFKAKPVPQGLSEDLFTLKLIGPSTDGPYCLNTGLTDAQRVIEVNSYEEAVEILRGGELLEAVLLASAPSTDSRFSAGPRKYKLYNTAATVKAATTLDSTLVATAHTITAINPGASGNKIRAKATYGASKYIEIGDERNIETSGSLTYSAMSIQYTGDGTAAALVISATGIVVTLTGQTDGSLNLSALFATYPKLGDLVNYINQQQGYVATLIGAPDFAGASLDHVVVGDAVDITVAAYTALADLYMQETFISGQGLAVLTSNAVRKPIATMAVFKFLTGGTTAAPTGTAVAEAILFAEKQPGLYTSLLSSSLSDALNLKASLGRLNSPDLANECFGSAGGATADSIATKLANAKSVASEWMVYGLSKFIGFDLLGVEKIYPPYMLGVIHNAIKASNNPRETPTYKNLNILRTDEVLTRSQRDQVIQAGALGLTQKPNGGPWYIDRAVTAYQASNLILNESSTVAVALAMTKELREFFEANFIGEVPADESVDPGVLQAPRESDLTSGLELKLQEFVSKGYLRGSAILDIPAFSKDYQVVIDGDAFYFLNVEARPVLPINFIFTLLSLVVIQGSTSSTP